MEKVKKATTKAVKEAALKGKKAVKEDARTGEEHNEETTAAVASGRVLVLKRGPRKSVEMMELLNEDQMSAVEDMGFGSLVHYKVTSLPGRLAYEMLESFDQDGWGVKYQHDILHLRKEDVQATFGVPKGTTRIVRNGHQKYNKFVDELARDANKTKNTMGPKYLTLKLLSDTKGDTKKAFSGPLSSLVPCYVDRIVLKTRLVARAFPTVKGWTTQLLNKRQKMELNPGPFGRGFEELIFDPRESGFIEQPKIVCISSSSEMKSKSNVESGRAKNRRAWMGTMHKTADAIAELMRMMKVVSEDVRNDV